MENNYLLLAPVKRKVSNNFRSTPEKITEMNDIFNKKMNEAYSEKVLIREIPPQPPFKKCTRRLKRGERKGEQCLKSSYKYNMCSYHWGVWKKNNPFLNHP